MKRPKAPGEGGRVRDPFLDALGENVKIARIRAKLSPKELAEALGTGQSWVYMVEDGQQNLQLNSLRRLAHPRERYPRPTRRRITARPQRRQQDHREHAVCLDGELPGFAEYLCARWIRKS